MNEEWVIYCIRNAKNGRVYVGATVDWRRRQTDHKSQLYHGRHPTKPLQNDWLEFGEAAFEFVALETVTENTPEALVAAEQKWFDALQASVHANGYNIAYPAWHSGAIENITRIPAVIPQDLLHRIDEYRFVNRIPSRAEAIRQLLETALTVKMEG